MTLLQNLCRNNVTNHKHPKYEKLQFLEPTKCAFLGIKCLSFLNYYYF